MFWVIPIKVIAWVMAPFVVVSVLPGLRYAAGLLTFGSIVVRGNYRLGEGPTTEKYLGRGVLVSHQSEDFGKILAQLSDRFEILPRPGILYEMTKLEAEELLVLLEVIVRHPTYSQLEKEEASNDALLPSVKALQNHLDRFPESRTRTV